MPKKILIVEDEANIRELLRLYLEREGYTVLEAENGVEGIKKWKSTPMDCGSIFTSSASGSCSLLAMDAALLCPTSNFGNSSLASLLAEYTDAPASLTITYCTFSGISFNSSTINCSDSLDAVPFPSEINVI